MAFGTSPFDDAKSAASLRGFFDSVPLPVAVLDEDARILAINTRAEATFLMTRAALFGQPGAALLDHSGGEQILADGAHAGDYTGRRGDGATFPFRAVFSTVSVLGHDLTAIIIDDLTERRAMETALRESEERYRGLIERASDAMYTTDLAGNFTWVNETGIALYGYSMDEFLGMKVSDVIDPIDRARANERMATRTAHGEMVPYTVLTRGRNGEGIWVDVTTRVIRDADGEPVAVQGIARDVTERMHAVEELRRSNEFRDRVMASTRNAIAALDAAGRLTLVNQRAEEMTGYTHDELIGSHLTMLFAPEARAHIIGEFAGALSDGDDVVDYEMELTRKDGGRVTVLFNAGPLIENGVTVGFAGTAEDITERRRAEALLAAQRHLLEMVAVDAPQVDIFREIIETVEEHAPGAICTILVVDEAGTALSCEACVSLPRHVCAALVGLPIGPDTTPCGRAAHSRSVVIVEDIESDPMMVPYRELAASGGLRSVWSAPIISSSGRILGTFAIYHREPSAPTEHEQTLVHIATHIAGIALERKLAQQAVIDRAEELERLYRQLVSAHDELEESKAALEEKSALLEAALAAERERSRRDPLTGALNHAAITEVMREHIADPARPPMAIAMVDVDGLKAANDTYGHQIGDAVLLAVARALDRNDAVTGRYGGDEFVAVLRGADRSAAEKYRDAVMEALAEQQLTDPDTGARIPLVISLGLSIYPEEALAVDDLIKLSDSAMYAQRRQRAAAAGSGVSRMLGSDRAAKMIGEIVPFLTTPGDVEEKLRLVSMRLSLGAGYDAVTFALYGGERGGAAASTTYAQANPELVEAWDAETGAQRVVPPIQRVLEEMRRPVIIDDIETTDLILESQRRMLLKAGLKSGLVAPMIWRGEVVGALSVASKQPAAFGPHDAQFVGAVATQVSSIVRTAALVDELQDASSQLLQAHTETVVLLAGAAEAHDATTGRHLQRVQALTEALALELGHEAETAKEIGLAAVLHDIGKIRVPDYVLTSSEGLGDNEWALMKQHTVWGGQFLAQRRGFELASQVARAHHERWDGSGYPDGLAGDDIPEAAQITSVADSLDAMTSDRPYRAGRPIDDAVTEVRAWSGRQFSPRVVEALVRLYARGELSRYLDDHPQVARAA